MGHDGIIKTMIEDDSMGKIPIVKEQPVTEIDGEVCFMATPETKNKKI